MAFLSLRDLIRSKETEREDDWRDIELLEEIQDERLRERAADAEGRVLLLSGLRSRRGFSLAADTGCLLDKGAVTAAWSRAENPITRAFLSPYLPGGQRAPAPPKPSMIDEILYGRLAKVEGSSPRHIALVEVVRRLY